eukprot:13742195-Alexandrium_andersonii.AAC.1
MLPWRCPVCPTPSPPLLPGWAHPPHVLRPVRSTGQDPFGRIAFADQAGRALSAPSGAAEA